MTQISTRKKAHTATVVAGCFAVLLAQVAYSLPGALNGTFQQEFGTTGAQLTWVTAAFAIPMVVLELTTGVIGDLFGRKRLLQAGAVLTVAGSVVSYFAGAVQVLWIGQVVAGVGAAILYPISLAMLAAVSPSPQARAKVIAVWAGFLSIGAAISPLLGGWLAQEGSWRTSYLVVVVGGGGSSATPHPTLTGARAIARKCKRSFEFAASSESSQRRNAAMISTGDQHSLPQPKPATLQA